MYNTKTATTNNEEFVSDYMPVGINTDVILKEIMVEKSTTGQDFLKIIFENSKEQTAEWTEWKNKKNTWIKTDEELQKRDDQQFGRVLQLVSCYIEDIPDAELNSFVDMINWVKTTLTPLIPTKKKLRLKVIYDKKGYIKVSSNGIFVEANDVNPSQIKLFKRDTLERPVQADKETGNDPFADNSTSVTGESSDLPF